MSSPIQSSPTFAVMISSQFPELNALIMRRFKGPNDVEEARQAVHKVCTGLMVDRGAFL